MHGNLDCLARRGMAGGDQTKSPSVGEGMDTEVELPFLPYHCPPLCLLSPSRQHLRFLFPLQCYQPLQQQDQALKTDDHNGYSPYYFKYISHKNIGRNLFLSTMFYSSTTCSNLLHCQLLQIRGDIQVDRYTSISQHVLPGSLTISRQRRS